jgi:hypothetical protein
MSFFVEFVFAQANIFSMPDTGDPAKATRHRLKQAWLRLLFGQLQIAGATADWCCCLRRA